MIKTIVSIGRFRSLLQQFQKEPSITFHSENCKQKGVSFFRCNQHRRRPIRVFRNGPTYSSRNFLDRRLKSAFESFDLSFFLAAAMRTFDVITGWQRRSNVHPLISRIMTSTLYSTSLSNVRYFCWIMHKFSSQFYNLIVKNQLWVFISHCV